MSSILEPRSASDLSLESEKSQLMDYSGDFVEVGSILAESPVANGESAGVKSQYMYGYDSVVAISSPADSVEPKKAETGFPATYFDRKAVQQETLDSGDFINTENPQETLIEREIRLQKEREEALARERQEALVREREREQVHRANATKPLVSNQDSTIYQHQKPLTIDVKENPEAVVGYVSPAEARISEEIRQLREREEELRKLREKNLMNLSTLEESEHLTSIPTTDEGHFSDPERDGHSDSHSSRVDSPETPSVSQEYSRFPHQRTQSMDSMSSGHSSGEHVIHGDFHAGVSGTKAKRNVLVKPLEEPEEEDNTPAYRRVLKETPIERDIRLAREREEALRREKGTPAWASPANKTEKEGRLGNRFIVSDKRDVHHRLATSRIQQEIDETVEREKELVSAGKIQTTSEERVDSKVARLAQLAEYGSANSEIFKGKRSNLSKSVSTPHLDQSGLEGAAPAAVEAPRPTVEEDPAAAKSKSLTRTASALGLGGAAARKFTSSPAAGQRGLMEKFLASRGKYSAQTTFTMGSGQATSTSSLTSVTPGSSAGDSGGGSSNASKTPVKVARHPVPPLNPSLAQPVTASDRDDVLEETKVALRPAILRRSYATAEEKIQEELREMKQREEELRASRLKLFAKSQPNLLELYQDHETAGSSLASTPDPTTSHRQFPNLGELSHGGEILPTVKGQTRRRSALIAQWESIIQQTNQ